MSLLWLGYARKYAGVTAQKYAGQGLQLQRVAECGAIIEQTTPALSQVAETAENQQFPIRAESAVRAIPTAGGTPGSTRAIKCALPIIALLIAAPLMAQPSKELGQFAYRAPRALTASQVALAVAATADIASSLNVPYETVPRWRQPDGRMALGRSAAVKAGVVAGAVLVQRWALRRWPHEKWIGKLAIGTNVAVASYWGGVAVSNWRVR